MGCSQGYSHGHLGTTRQLLNNYASKQKPTLSAVETESSLRLFNFSLLGIR